MAEMIDINCDMGESYGRWSLGDDAGIMPFISSANIACGWHGGDPGVMRATVALAKDHGVGVGVHCGLPDLLGFGRRQMSVTSAEARDYILYQYGALRAFADAAGATIEHVKPHGAFYVMINGDPALTEALIEAIDEADPDLVVVLMRGSAIAQLRDHGIRVVPEAFPDLEYTADGGLILERAKLPRDPEWVAERMARVVSEGRLRASDGTDLTISARTFCLHGDGPNAVEVAKGVRQRLEADNIRVARLQVVAGVTVEGEKC